MRTIGYIRVSTEQQSESGLSLESQRAKIEAMGVVKGWDVEVLVDTVSAKDLHRPAMQDLLQRVRAGRVDAVIIAKLDRLTRSVKDLAELVELFNRKGVALVSVAETLDTGSAAGRMVMNIMATVAQWEREVISERTGDALKAKRKRGEAAGNIPYGYRAEGGKLVEDEAEQSITAQAKTMRSAGKSLREIAEELNRAGLTTRRGTEWRFQYVANVLRGAK